MSLKKGAVCPKTVVLAKSFAQFPAIFFEKLHWLIFFLVAHLLAVLYPVAKINIGFVQFCRKGDLKQNSEIT